MEFAVFFEEFAPILMFLALALLLFSGFPVAFILAGIGIAFAFLGDWMEMMNIGTLNLLPLRIFGGVVESPVLVAIPMFIYMGTMLERSGVAKDLLYALQVLTRRIPGGLALSITIMGTIMAATTGIIGASVVMMTLLALPIMLEQKYNVPLATGTIAASGTLGILIPPSIMLVIMADLMELSVGNVFVAAMVPGLMLAMFYMIYIVILCTIKPELAPPLAADIGPKGRAEFWGMIARSFLPPVFLITLVLGSIFAGFATPTEAAGVGAIGSTLLAAFKLKLSRSNLTAVCQSSAMTTAMLFGIFVGATCFSLIFRKLGGEILIEEIIVSFGSGPWTILFVLMGTIFLLGFFFDWIEITLIVLPVFGPVMENPEIVNLLHHVAPQVQADITAGVLTGVDAAKALEAAGKTQLLWFTILIAVNLQTSFLTPPFGFALFYMKGVAPPEVKIQQIYRGIIPFVILQLIGLGMVIAFPKFALWLPSVLLE